MDKAPVIKIRPDIEIMPPEDCEPPELKIAVVENHERYCEHGFIKVFPHHRVVSCAECGAILDPFDYLLLVGKLEIHKLSNVKYYKKEVERLVEQIEILKEEKSRLKSAINNLKKK